MSTYNHPHLTEICSNGPSISAYGRLLTFDEALYELSSEDQDRLRPYTTGAPGTIGGKLLQIVEAVNNQVKVLSWRKSVGLRAAAYRIMEWTRVIDPVGQAATSAFPLYAAFPWAAFRILAEVLHKSEETPMTTKLTITEENQGERRVVTINMSGYGESKTLSSFIHAAIPGSNLRRDCTSYK